MQAGRLSYIYSTFLGISDLVRKPRDGEFSELKRNVTLALLLLALTQLPPFQEFQIV